MVQEDHTKPASPKILFPFFGSSINIGSLMIPVSLSGLRI